MLRVCLEEFLVDTAPPNNPFFLQILRNCSCRIQTINYSLHLKKLNLEGDVTPPKIINLDYPLSRFIILGGVTSPLRLRFF